MPPLSSKRLLDIRMAAEDAAMDVYSSAETLADWQQKGHQTKYEDDTEVLSQQIDFGGPYDVTYDPGGNEGHWSVELIRTTTRQRHRAFLGDIGMRRILLPAETSVALRVNVYDVNLEDPFDVLRQRAPVSAAVHEAGVFPNKPFDVVIDAETPYGQLVVLQRDHEFARNWLGVVLRNQRP
jgi:hypothetical protein